MSKAGWLALAGLLVLVAGPVVAWALEENVGAPRPPRPERREGGEFRPPRPPDEELPPEVREALREQVEAVNAAVKALQAKAVELLGPERGRMVAARLTMRAVQEGGPPPRREGDAAPALRREGDAPRREGDAPRREGDAPRREGDAPRRFPRPDGAPILEGNRER